MNGNINEVIWCAVSYKICIVFVVTQYYQVGGSELVRGTWCCHFLGWRHEESKSKCSCTVMSWDMSHKLHNGSLLNVVMWCFSTNHDLLIFYCMILSLIAEGQVVGLWFLLEVKFALKDVTKWLPESKTF